MSLLDGVAPADLAGRAGPDDSSARRPPLPAWPVLVLLYGLPAWWALGLLPFSTVIVAIPMTMMLIQRGRTGLVPGVLPWLAFVLWMAPCAVMLGELGRILGFGIRFAQFAAVAVILIYVVNARVALTPRRILKGLVGVWLAVILCGFLGVFWPTGRLTMTVGLFLPGGIVDNEYVSDLVFPAFAEIQNPWGAAEPFLRPSAPFAYTNGWGAAIAMLTPIAVGAAIYLGGKYRFWVPFGMLLSIVPAVASTNRGLFLTLAISFGYVIVRLLFRGSWRALLWSIVGSIVAFVILLQTGFLDLIAERQDAADTSQGRTNLYEETFSRTLDSPILGFGAPRPSFTSEITVGTQGMVWNALFCFGFVGIALFMIFVLGAAARTWAAPGSANLWLHSSLVATAVMSIYYGLDRQILFFVIIAGLLLRERYASRSDLWAGAPRRTA